MVCLGPAYGCQFLLDAAAVLLGLVKDRSFTVTIG